MFNYTEVSIPDLDDPTDVYDVLADIRDDVNGLAMTMLALSEQSGVIEPEQAAVVSEVLHYIHGALVIVLKHMDGHGADGGAAGAKPDDERPEGVA